MIKHLRIDNRLIHGQVAVTWMNSIGADKIIVCNDKVAADPIQKMALPMAARGNTVYVFSIDETIKYATEHPEETIFLIGGAEVYNSMIGICDEAIITYIHKTFEADAYFPNLDSMEDWEMYEEEDEIMSEKGVSFNVRHYRRK